MSSLRRAASAAASGSRRRDTGIVDKRYQIIRDVLYKPEQPRDAAPTPEELARTEMIERVWSLTRVREARRIEEHVLRKYKAMRLAMEELKKTDTWLFEATGAFRKAPTTPEITTLFPRRLRVPTDTIPQ
ncbi:hypothetical protein HDU96_005394 [Phlyctochytrium bullatum]|nr:hypothetical protein HDU96_005394 [Phlyctochytrium bullatum]